MLVENALCAFYASQDIVDQAVLEDFTRKHLPYYSVPEKWFQVDSIPLTNNGKVDRKALRAMISDQSKDDSGIDVSLEKSKQTSVGVTVETSSSLGSSTVSLKDPEKTAVTITSSASHHSSISTNDILEKLPEALPPKHSYHGLRWLRHRAFILYRRFLSVVILTNIAVAVFLLHRRIGEKRDILSDLALATASNLVVAVLMRSEPVINLLFTVFCSVPVSQNVSDFADGLVTDCAPLTLRHPFL